MLTSEVDTEQSAETPSSDTLTTGCTPVGTDEAEPSTTGRMPVVKDRTEPLKAERMPVVKDRTEPLTTGRMPVVIPGARKKQPSRSPIPVKTKHRVLLHASVVFMLTMFILTTLVTFLPLGKDGQALGLGGLLQNIGVMKLVGSNSRDTVLVGAQAATATAIMQNDGYDPGRAVSAQYNTSLGVNAGSNNFPYGQCTYWADYRYHQLAGYWVPWSGNAYQWAYNAPAYAGWVVSSSPHVPSIVVFQPGVQYANSTYGHVAVLESINADGSLHTSNMNIYGYSFGTRVDLTNYVGSGVSFVYHT